jgi:hypothetical protein
VYELLWGCNVAMVLAPIGLLYENTALLGAAVAVVSVDQTLWWFDILGRLVNGRYYVGVSKYIEESDEPMCKRVSAFHHLVFLPLGVRQFVVARACIPVESFYLCCFVTASLCLYARVSSPFFTRLTAGGVYYLNVNLAYEMWRDVPIKAMHAFDGTPAYVCE